MHRKKMHRNNENFPVRGQSDSILQSWKTAYFLKMAADSARPFVPCVNLPLRQCGVGFFRSLQCSVLIYMAENYKE